MRDPSADRRLLQLFENRINGSAYMQDDRQVGGSCDFELRVEIAYLQLRRDFCLKKVETDFTHRNRRVRTGRLASQPVSQRFQIVFLCGSDVLGMNAICRKTTDITLAAIANGSKVPGVDGRNQKTVDAAPVCGFIHRIAIRLELGRIQMTVGVEQHI